MPLLPHEILNDRYRIISLLAEGAYGAVYRAWDLRAEKECAIKEYLDSSGQVQRAFRAEARRLSRLQHEGLPEILDHFALDNVGQYLVMAYIDGVSLQELLDQYGPLPSDLIIQWLQETSVILNYIHEQDSASSERQAGQHSGDTGRSNLPCRHRPTRPGHPAGQQRAMRRRNRSRKQQAISRQSDIYSLWAPRSTTLLTNQNTTRWAAPRKRPGRAEIRPRDQSRFGTLPLVGGQPGHGFCGPMSVMKRPSNFANASEPPLRPDHLSAGWPPVARTTPFTAGCPRQSSPCNDGGRLELRTIGGLLFLIIFFTRADCRIFLCQPAEKPCPVAAKLTRRRPSNLRSSPPITAIASPDPPTPTPTLFPTATPSPIENETGSRMLYVPGGVFRMGNDEGENNERPSHLAVLQPYYIDETEVTNGEYKACVSDGACAEPDRLTASYHPAYYSSSEYDNYPVIFVNWDKANTFCEWRNARLPTEAEWERAAGFDPIEFERTLYPWGNNFNGTLLNYCDVNCAQEWRDTQFDDGHQDTAQVGSYPEGRSPIGAADMLGNVMEWVADWYDAGYYAEAAEQNPLGPLDGEAKVIRGGSWFSRNEVTITTRGSFVPEVSRANLGFRCAMDLP